MTAELLRKKCLNCKEIKPLDEFTRERKGNESRRSRCKKCSYKDVTTLRNYKRLVKKEDVIEMHTLATVNSQIALIRHIQDFKDSALTTLSIPTQKVNCMVPNPGGILLTLSPNGNIWARAETDKGTKIMGLHLKSPEMIVKFLWQFDIEIIYPFTENGFQMRYEAPSKQESALIHHLSKLKRVKSENKTTKRGKLKEHDDDPDRFFVKDLRNKGKKD